MNITQAVWRVFYRAKPDGVWTKDGDYDHDEAVERVFEITRNTEEGEFDAFTSPVKRDVNGGTSFPPEPRVWTCPFCGVTQAHVTCMTLRCKGKRS